MQYPVEIPALVAATKHFASSLGFEERPEGNRAGDTPVRPSSCVDEVGSLLRSLSASVVTGTIGEIGTGAGVEASWIASGLRPDSKFVTVEIDKALTGPVEQQFASFSNVEVLCGDWREEFVTRAPFDLLFLDGGGSRHAAQEIAGLIKEGGVIVIDDLTPESLWPNAWRGRPDPKRELAFNSGLFTSTEVHLRPNLSTLLLVKT